MKASTNIKTKQRRQLRLSDFRGVDFFSSPTAVQANRATDMLNFTHENGKIQKRNGWEQIIKNLPGRINMIYPFENEGVTELLIYAGKEFYHVKKAPERSASNYIVEKIMVPLSVTLKDQRCTAFEQNGVLYIVGCGTYVQYNKYPNGTGEIVAVDPYIPTTTIDIDPEGSEMLRASLDLPNLMTRKRKNKLVGGTAGSKWKLDANIATIGGPVSHTTIEHLKETLSEDGTTVLSQTAVYTIRFYTIFDQSNTEIGRISAANEITLDIDTTPLDVGTRNNLTVTFSADGKGMDPIDESSIGILFGVGGTADRLFLAGTPTMKNAVWISEVDNFAYFPDQYTAVFGTDQQAITSFMRLNDNTLAVFKEYRPGETSVYYLTGEYRTQYDEEGFVEKITPVFSITAGATSESAVNPWCTVNLSGDNLILSKNGVFSIELRENIQTNDRIASLRSLAITPKLRQHASFLDAVAISFQGKYYLSVDGVCYVADSLYSYRDKNSSTSQYEWWYWENVPARVWAEIDGMLCFGTENGRICAFKEGYADKGFDLGESGDFVINHERDCITYNARYTPKKGERFNIRTDNVFAVVVEAEDYTKHDEAGWFVLKKDAKIAIEDLLAYEGVPLRYFDKDDSNLFGNTYMITEVNIAERTFVVTDSNGIGFSAMTYNGDFLLDVSWIDLYVSELIEYEDENGRMSKGFTVKLHREDETDLRFADVETMEDEEGKTVTVGAANITVMLFHESVVKARWVTPIFDFGTNESAKTLYKLTVSVDPKSYGRLRFGYNTRFSFSELGMNTARPFSFEDLNFESFSFETGFWKAYSVKVKVPRFNYISFWFESDTEEFCSINDLTVTYAINSRILGVL